jgi:hypothetical protein
LLFSFSATFLGLKNFWEIFQLSSLLICVRDGGIVGALFVHEKIFPEMNYKKATAESPTRRDTPQKEAVKKRHQQYCWHKQVAVKKKSRIKARLFL